MTESKSKIGVVSGVIRAMGLESEEPERFHLFRLCLQLHCLHSTYDPVKTRLLESEEGAEG